MKKIRYYLDTSIFNFVFADDSPDKKDLTERFFQKVESEKLDIYISSTVLDEINKTKNENLKISLRNLIEKQSPIILTVDSEVKDLANRYIQEGMIPDKYMDDAIHIAVAVVNDLDIILSWNFEHIVKLKTRIETNSINRVLGYHQIEICSPLEVVEP